MRMKLICTVAFALSLCPTAFAGDEEYMEVTAPDLSGAPLPSGLGLLAGFVGASGASGAATMKQVALKQAIKTVQETKSKKAEEKKDEQQQQENEFDKATNGNPGVLQTLIHEVGLTLRQLLDNGAVLEAETKDADGSTTTIKDCRPSGPLNPNKLPCTQQKLELFTDPTDGVERWVWSLAVVEGKYNPKHYYADADGYHAEVVDKQVIYIIFDNMEDFTWQFNQAFPAK